MIPGASALITKYMEKQIEKQDFPDIHEFVEMIHDTGAGLYACLASVDLFGMERDDLIDDLDGDHHRRRVLRDGRRRRDRLHVSVVRRGCP